MRAGEITLMRRRIEGVKITKTLHDNRGSVIVQKLCYMGIVLSKITDAALRYIHDVLGFPVPVARPWADESQLPYFLRDEFLFGVVELLGQTVLLAIKRPGSKQSLGDVKTWTNKIREVSGLAVLYVTDAMASYERRRLIEQKVSFLVPGNQLYLPDLGLDLREYFRKRASPSEAALSPSAQALLIKVLLHKPWQPDWQTSKLAAAAGYTSMTLSRAVKELTALGLAEAFRVGRSQWIRFVDSPEQVWERARPALRTPVKRTVWVPQNGVAAPKPGRIAGESALARYSLMSEPKCPVYALTVAEWKAQSDAGVKELPEPDARAQEWQLWSYSPAMGPDATTVDPLSLMLSFQEHPDDRIQIALDELKGQFPW